MSGDVKDFLADLSDDEKTEVLACIRLLKEHGPFLRRPHSDTLRGSKHSNMKELRVPYERKQFRILYAFDAEQDAILLVGGDKVPLGEKRWYPKFIARADELFDEHIAKLKAQRKPREAAGPRRKSGGKRGKS